MNREQALAVCPDFRPVKIEEGKIKCVFYNNDGICKRPEYFRCELVLHREALERENIKTVSVSRVGTILRCPRLYALTYVYGVEPPLPATWKIVGRVFSDCRAKIDLGLQYNVSGAIDSMPVDRARLKAVLRHYAEWQRPYGEILNEVRVFFSYKDIHFIGYLDVLTRDQKDIWEWKYAATVYDEIKVLRQAAVYLHGIPDAERFHLIAAKKPMQRLKKDETPTELERRIYEELANKKDELFTVTTYDRNFFNVEAVLEQCYQIARLPDYYDKIGYPPALGMNCENCDFRPYCLKHVTEIGCSRAMCSHPHICAAIRSTREEKKLPNTAKLVLPSV